MSLDSFINEILELVDLHNEGYIKREEVIKRLKENETIKKIFVPQENKKEINEDILILDSDSVICGKCNVYIINTDEEIRKNKF